jgi:putative nucleotidyltransferase with HDIG domain
MTNETPRILWAVTDEPCDTLYRGEFSAHRVESFDDASRELDLALHADEPFAIFWFEWSVGLDHKFLKKIAAQAPELYFVVEGDEDILPSPASLSQLMSSDRVMCLEKPVIPSMRRSIARHLGARLNEDRVMLEAQRAARRAGTFEFSDQKRLDMVYSTVERLHAARSLPDGLATTLSEIAHFLGARTASFVILEDGDTLRVVEAIGPGSERIIGQSMPLSSSRIAKHALSKNEPVLVTNMNNDERFEEASGERRYRASSVLSVPISAKHRPLAVLNFGGDADVASFTQRDSELVVTLARQFAVALEKDTLMNHLRTAMSGSIRALAGAIEAKDPYTRGHSDRVTHFSVLSAIEIGMSPADVEIIKQAAILHDIGKIGVPGDVLNKKGRLDDEEYNVIQQHPDIGISIVRQIGAMDATLPIIRAHHEKLDGTGYPNNLKGDNIPMGARVLAVADAYDAMTSDRPYRKGMPVETALEELKRCAGTHFDPLVAEVFCHNIHHWPHDDNETDPLTTFV